jgi:hypothetical protein
MEGLSYRITVIFAYSYNSFHTSWFNLMLRLMLVLYCDHRYLLLNYTASAIDDDPDSADWHSNHHSYYHDIFILSQHKHLHLYFSPIISMNFKPQMSHVNYTI